MDSSRRLESSIKFLKKTAARDDNNCVHTTTKRDTRLDSDHEGELILSLTDDQEEPTATSGIVRDLVLLDNTTTVVNVKDPALDASLALTYWQHGHDTAGKSAYLDERYAEIQRRASGSAVVSGLLSHPRWFAMWRVYEETVEAGQPIERQLAAFERFLDFAERGLRFADDLADVLRDRGIFVSIK